MIPWLWSFWKYDHVRYYLLKMNDYSKLKAGNTHPSIGWTQGQVDENMVAQISSIKLCQRSQFCEGEALVSFNLIWVELGRAIFVSLRHDTEACWECHLRPRLSFFRREKFDARFGWQKKSSLLWLGFVQKKIWELRHHLSNGRDPYTRWKLSTF